MKYKLSLLSIMIINIAFAEEIKEYALPNVDSHQSDELSLTRGSTFPLTETYTATELGIISDIVNPERDPDRWEARKESIIGKISEFDQRRNPNLIKEKEKALEATALEYLTRDKITYEGSLPYLSSSKYYDFEKQRYYFLSEGQVDCERLTEPQPHSIYDLTTDVKVHFTGCPYIDMPIDIAEKLWSSNPSIPYFTGFMQLEFTNNKTLSPHSDISYYGFKDGADLNITLKGGTIALFEATVQELHYSKYKTSTDDSGKFYTAEIKFE